jgi:outer membrane protein assembly factor BamD (BamD/ComL family)
LLLAVPLMLATSGCALKDYLWEPPTRPVRDAMSIRTGVPTGNPSELSPELAAAHEKLKAGDVAAAEKAFHKVADNQKNPPTVAEEARYYEAECLFQQDQWPKACDTYHKMLMDFPSGTYRARACKRMFDIANFWCDDIRKEQVAKREAADKKWSVVLTPVVHFEKQKPFLDLEGRALQTLEQVHLNDIGGPLADKALFLAGGIKFYREDYKEADYYYSQLVEQHPNSELAPKAIELGIIAKHLSTGGSDYDGKKVAEARLLVDTAIRAYPELARDKSDFLNRQVASIDFQQAEKDFNIAEFYRRTKHPGAAYYYYEIVRRAYPNTRFAEQATQRMMEIRQDYDAGRLETSENDVFKLVQHKWDAWFNGQPDRSLINPPDPKQQRSGATNEVGPMLENVLQKPPNKDPRP